MAGQKFLTQSAGAIVEAVSTQTGSTGNENKIPSLDATGRLDTTMMPVGIGADTASITASENLAAGDYVNVWASTGFKVRKADASVAGKEAHGFVLAAVTSGNSATVYFEGSNTQVTGQTAGPVYLSAATAGAGTATPPSGSGNAVQCVGFATSATSVNFQSNRPIILA